MRKLGLTLVLALAAGCNSRAHIRTYDLDPQAQTIIEDENKATWPITIGDKHLVSSDKEALVVVEDVRQRRYPLRKGWAVERDDDSFTIREIPDFKPY